MAYDLSLAPNTGIHTQLCGDAHVQNLGAFAGPDGRLIFDINDFDETLRGPFEWDVKRMATSILLAGRDATSSPPPPRRRPHFLDAYRSLIKLFPPLPILEVARYQVHRLAGVQRPSRRSSPRPSAPRRSTLSKPSPTAVTPKGRVFNSIPPVLTPRRAAAERAPSSTRSPPIAELLQPERRHFFAQFRPIDVAFKVVGTGSVGLRDYCRLPGGQRPRDPLFLQIKEEYRLLPTPPT